MRPAQKFDLTCKDGTLLNTEKKYCRQNILVLPKLNPLIVTENGTYPVPDGYAGNGQVKVNVSPKKETSLIISGNGTYIAPTGTVYTSIVVNVPTDSGGTGDSSHVHKYASEVTEPSCTTGGYTTHTCSCGHTYITNETAALGHSYVNGVCERCWEAEPSVTPEVDRGSYTGIVGDVFDITYNGSSPEVVCPDFLYWQDDGGVLLFTAAFHGSGLIQLFRYGELVGEYTVIVEAAGDYDYTLEIGDTFSISYGASSPSVVCPACLSYQDDGGELIFTAEIVGSGTLRLYQDGALIASYTVCVTAQESGSDTHEHQFAAVVTPPTCTEAGYTTHSCAECGYSYRDTPVPAHHIPGDPVLVREATCEMPSEYVIRCTRCEEELSRWEDDGEFADHIEDSGSVTREPDCTTRGIITYRCSVCDTWLREEYIDALGHAFRDPEPDPSVSSGTSITCERCGHTEEY